MEYVSSASTGINQSHMLIPETGQGRKDMYVQRVSVCKPFVLGMQSMDAILLSGQAFF